MGGARKRTSLSQRGGRIRSRGDAGVAAQLGAILRDAEGREDDALTHGFHVYPARMHHLVARGVLELHASPDAVVLDPFCGSGTALIEARRLGMASIGVDLSPIALMLARVKSEVRDAAARERFMATAEGVAERSMQRVRERAPAMAPIPRSEVRWYQGHVLKELAGLFEEIGAVEDAADRRALQMVFSAMVVKFSRQRADTSEEVADKRIGKKVVSGFFRRKAGELVQRWARLASEVPAGSPRPELILGDARELPTLLGGRRCGLVLTSPPYGGTYDYAQHHARRLAWLGFDGAELRRGEVGARRNLARNPEAARRWDAEVRAALVAIAKVTAPAGRCVFVMGDAKLGRRRVPADAQLERLGGEVGLRFVAAASQRRRDWSGGPPREEHLVVLAR